MKKYVLLVAIVLFVGYNLLCNKEIEMSDLMLANVEALAEDESSTSPCDGDESGCFTGWLWYPTMKEKL